VRPTQSVPTILNPNASSQRSFMSAGSVTLGTNLSVAVGPLGRNGEASGSISTGGKITATYSYSKTRGLFGGVSLEGSVIVERQDANCLAYQSDVTAKQLLSGAIPTPEWASGLIKTLESRTGMPGGHKWVQDPDTPTKSTSQYAFGGIPSPSNELSKLRKRSSSSPFSWGKRSTNDSYFSSTDGPTSSPSPTREQPPGHRRSQTHGFATQFQSDYTFDPIKAPPPEESMLIDFDSEEDRLPSNRSDGMQREIAERASTKSDLLTFDSDEEIQPLDASSKPSRSSSLRYRAELSSPLNPKDGVGRAIALFDFVAREAGDLSLKKGDIIVITEKTDRVDDW
jgi:SH3 domain-containing YSC84-like protein 1